MAGIAESIIAESADKDEAPEGDDGELPLAVRDASDAVLEAVRAGDSESFARSLKSFVRICGSYRDED